MRILRTCHWCHVMAHESFEDQQVAELLNESFVCIKVDKEERPDIDSIYMNVCQMLTQSGGWPLSVFMTPEQKPFFAGMYFPKQNRHGTMGFIELLGAVIDKWTHSRSDLLTSGEQIADALKTVPLSKDEINYEDICQSAFQTFQMQFDSEYGGFGKAPKFPTPHILLFLLKMYELKNEKRAFKMVEKTLIQMYKGGIFDHIGYGFSRYSTDRYWLAPHFEKMLYDNALLVLAYTQAFQTRNNELFQTVVERTLCYIGREMTSPEGGFYSAQDADSEGEEGKYYVFSAAEIFKLFGNLGSRKFKRYYGITESGNFEGKNIPNLIKTDEYNKEIEKFAEKAYTYRKNRMPLGKDDKILTAWNGLMIAAYTEAYMTFQKKEYLAAAKKAVKFVEKNLWDEERLYASYRNGHRMEVSFLDDYAFMIFAYLKLYAATFEEPYLTMAETLTKHAVTHFFDDQDSGFFLTSHDGENLIHRPKEYYDGAIPSGNSVMAWNIQRLARLLKDEELERLSEKQNEYMGKRVSHYPSGNCFFLYSLMDTIHPPKEIVCVLKDEDELEKVCHNLPNNCIVRIFKYETKEYKLLNAKTTYYVCNSNACLPPTNEIPKTYN